VRADHFTSIIPIQSEVVMHFSPAIASLIEKVHGSLLAKQCKLSLKYQKAIEKKHILWYTIGV
jgi:hypothetical protein